MILGGVIVLGFIITILIPRQNSGGETERVKIISRNGLHWHPNIQIRIRGEEIPVPAGIGLGVRHNPIHTHETDNIIHLEFSGIVSDRSLELGEFFKAWGKTLTRDCVLDTCSGPEGQLVMLVNGTPNDEFEKYVMRDGDRIEIIYDDQTKTNEQG